MGLSEADTRAKLIDPAIRTRGWTEETIRREETAGTIDILQGTARKRPKGRVDYTLRLRLAPDAQPVAVALIEAKAEHLPATHGLEQAKLYAASRRLNVPFVFATNGHQFVEFDRFTLLTSAPRALAEFPTPADLRARYEAGMGFGLDDPAARPLLARYAGGEAARRYYQDAAIRAVFEKIARAERGGGPRRALLSLATGAGKTFIAVNLLKRVADAGLLRRALFVCDRDELRTQAAGAFQNVFGAEAAVVTSVKPQKNARVLIATYQTLGLEGGDATFLATHYPEDYFSHIVLDECHRSAWGEWSEVLRRNPGAVQIGLTATPRQLVGVPETDAAKADAQVTADNVAYFGDPVYEYDIGQGIDDGYLAACEIRVSRVNLDDTGVSIADVLARRPVDAVTGQPVTAAELRALYERTTFEDRIILPDRVIAMCEDLFAHLLATGGPEQKTIIFCARDRHADEVAATMNNLYAAWCRESDATPAEPYAFKCTAASGGGDFLADFKASSRRFFVATTVDLLTTGVDVPAVRNVVFFRYVKSPISFYQMVGRGTRLDPTSGKLMFRVYDYTSATRLFGGAFHTRAAPDRERGDGPDTPPERRIVVQGFDVRVTEAGRYVVTQVDGRAMPVTIEEYKARLAERLVAEAPTLEQFRAVWVRPPDRRSLIEHLPEGGRSALLVSELEGLDACDLYDVLGEIGYGVAPKTRVSRAGAFEYKHEAWLAGMPPRASKTVRAIANQFALAGTDGLENPAIFQVPDVRGAGGLPALQLVGKPADVLMETKYRMFAA
jgi:type I restriction enzyme R subunit